jgi:hypothetical protein
MLQILSTFLVLLTFARAHEEVTESERCLIIVLDGTNSMMEDKKAARNALVALDKARPDIYVSDYIFAIFRDRSW